MGSRHDVITLILKNMLYKAICFMNILNLSLGHWHLTVMPPWMIKMEQSLRIGELVSQSELYVVQKDGGSANMPQRKATDMMAFTRYFDFCCVQHNIFLKLF